MGMLWVGGGDAAAAKAEVAFAIRAVPIGVSATADRLWSRRMHTPAAAGLAPSSLVLLVEDADAPSLEPLVHGIVVDLPPQDGGLGEGALTEPASRAGLALGKNSFLKAEWLPPDPPPGHGQHRYVFQIFALGAASAFGAHPGRGEVIDHVRKHGIGKGVLIGTYQR